MDSKEMKEEQALENKCPTCTASLKFNPTVGKFKCDYCGNEYTLEDLKKYENNASTDEKNDASSAPVSDTYSGYVSFRCESCGAEIITDEQTAATFCVYCGNTAILKSKLSGEFTPQRIIPFQKDKSSAVEAFKNLKKGRPLMPKDFTNEQNIEKIKGIYIPFWLYDVGVFGDVVMNGEIITSWSSGDTHYTKTDTYKVVRGGEVNYKNIPVDGSSRFDNEIMNSLEPFDYTSFVPYNHAYLSGFYAEKYDESGEKTYEEAKERALNSTKNYLKDDAKRYTSTIITSTSLADKGIKKEYVMLPVWMVNVKYKDKLYLFAMNGQTGEFIGNIPLDVKKTILYTIGIFITMMLLVWAVTYWYFGG